ncbi:MAG: tetratricopeptide repeat protein [Acidobacteriota bacterium]
MAINRIKISRAAEKLVRQGRVDAAITEYKRLLDDSPEDLATLNKVGDLYRQSGQIHRALPCFQKIAEHYRDRGFAQKAIAMFKKIAKLDPDNLDVLEQLVALYTEQGLVREALRNLRHAARIAGENEEPERALEFEYRALELSPDDCDGQRSLAQRLRDAGETERSIAGFLRAADGYAAAEKVDTAVECCHEALAVAPLDPTPAECLCRLLLDRDQSERAVKEVEALLEADPNTPHLLVLLGEALLRCGEVDRAEEAIERVSGTAAAEGNIDFQLARASIHVARREMEPALEAFNRVIPLLIESSRFECAARLLTDALDVEPGNGAVLRLLLSVSRAAPSDRPLDRAWKTLRRDLPGTDMEDQLRSVPGTAGKEHRASIEDETGNGPASPAGSPAANVPVTRPAVDPPAPVMENPEADDEDVDEGFISEHMTEADVFVKYRLLPKAVAHLKRIIERYPSTVVAHQRLMALYAELGEPQEASYHAAALARVHQRRGNLDEARAVLRTAGRKDPRNESLKQMRVALTKGQALPAYVPGTRATPAPPAPPSAGELPAADRTEETGEPAEPVLAAVTDEEVVDLLAGDLPAATDTVPAGAATVSVNLPSGEDTAAGMARPAGADSVATEAPAADPPAEADSGGFFDLAGAIEEDLARDELEASLTSGSVDDTHRDESPAQGIQRAIQAQVGDEDHQTHYQLGIAFKEMGMLDEAIGEFQQAARDPDNFAACCSMLGLCFRDKGMPKIAESWYRRGLDSVGADTGGEQRLGLIYDLAELSLSTGDLERAEEGYTEVYASNANYREVASRLREVQAQATGSSAERPSP